MKEGTKKDTMSNKAFDRIRIRRSWKINPVERVHSVPKGKRAYDRNESKRDWQRDME